MELNPEDKNAIALAQTLLRQYPASTEKSSLLHVGYNQCIDPKVLVQAVLDFAPFTAGKLNIAKAIMDTLDENTDTISNSKLETLAKQIFNNLLVPCLFLHLRS